MERGSFCYFCGTELFMVANDDDGTCFECGNCPPVTHWRWNDDTEFLQLYVAGERCPYCGTVIPESTVESPVEVAVAAAPAAPAAPVPAPEELDAAQTAQRRQGGKPVTVNNVWWESVVKWCRANNSHDTRKHHNCSKELARMQSRGEADVVWHNRDRIPGTRELLPSGSD